MPLISLSDPLLPLDVLESGPLGWLSDAQRLTTAAVASHPMEAIVGEQSTHGVRTTV